jgi:wyosine [tRNA(Phe)-imidazoG37] synthetase (radical SAM superfamily)
MNPKNIHVYGPVPSRRLGFSLGVDILPFKTCTLDCIYCQLGRTPEKTLIRKEFFPKSEILSHIRKKIQSGSQIDYITFSGSGEPTLYSGLGELIENIKNMTDIPVAVLTNSTTMTSSQVRKELMAADLIVPSLDAATQPVFEKINRPHPELRMDDIIQGLSAFKQTYTGRLWVEILLVKGVNDSDKHVQALRQALNKIKPDKVQLNTVVRPPAESFARPLNFKELEHIQSQLNHNCEIVADFSPKHQIAISENLKESILAMIRRRPVTLKDIADSLGMHKNEVIKYLNILLNESAVKTVAYEHKTYYEPEENQA